MLVPTGLRLVGAYAAAADESQAELALQVRQLDKLLPPQLVSAAEECGWGALQPVVHCEGLSIQL